MNNNVIIALFLFVGVIASLAWLLFTPTEESLEPLVATLTAIGLLFTHFFQQQKKAKEDIDYITAYDRILPYALFYRRRLRDRHKFADVRAAGKSIIFSLKLQAIFVEPLLTPSPPDKVRGSIIPEPVGDAANSKTIWQYFSSPSLKDLNFVILGPPGCGKTALMKHIALKLANKRGLFLNRSLPRALPTLLFLRNHASNIITRERYTLAEAIEYSISLWGPKPPANWVDRYLATGKFLVLFDGLDEVPSSQRFKISQWVQQQLNTHNKLTFILTSRPHGYRDNPLNGVMSLSINDFTPDQVEDFVSKWYLSNEILAAGGENDFAVRLRAREGARDLVNRINSNEPMRDLSINPLLLTIIATVHFFYDALPENRVELYEQICQLFLSTWQKAQNVRHDKEFTLDQQLHVLRTLAFYMMDKHTRDLAMNEACDVIMDPLRDVSLDTSPEDFLSMLQGRSGLVVAHEVNRFSFAHLTFQEYLAAEYIHKQGLEETLRQHIADEWWKETIILYSARADASRIIEACLADINRTQQTLILAILCLDQAKAIYPAVRIRLLSMLSDGLDESEYDIRMQVLEAFLRLRIARLVPIDQTLQVDADLISNGEYQLFVEQSRINGLYVHPDHWMTNQFDSGSGMNPVTGVRSNDADEFCQWLTKYFGQDGWTFRLPEKNEFSQRLATLHKYQRTMPTKSVGYWVSVNDDSFEVEFDARVPTSLKPAIFHNQLQVDKVLLQETGIYNEIITKHTEQAIDTFVSAILAEDYDKSSGTWLIDWIDLEFSRKQYQAFCHVPVTTILKHYCLKALLSAVSAAQSFRELLLSIEEKYRGIQRELSSEIESLIKAHEAAYGQPRTKKGVYEGGVDQTTQNLFGKITELDQLINQLVDWRNPLETLLTSLEQIQLKLEQQPILPKVTEELDKNNETQFDIIDLCYRYISQRQLSSQMEELAANTSTQVHALQNTMSKIVNSPIHYSLDNVQKNLIADSLEAINQIDLTSLKPSEIDVKYCQMIARAIVRTYYISIAALKWQTSQNITANTPAHDTTKLDLPLTVEVIKFMQHFASFTLLEERIQKRITAVEGIRIVREKTL